jgi:hypothetical protein
MIEDVHRGTPGTRGRQENVQVFVLAAAVPDTDNTRTSGPIE